MNRMCNVGILEHSDVYSFSNSVQILYANDYS
jgi:hypothetical protein